MSTITTKPGPRKPFDESLHPRDAQGRWTTTPGGGAIPAGDAPEGEADAQGQPLPESPEIPTTPGVRRYLHQLRAVQLGALGRVNPHISDWKYKGTEDLVLREGRGWTAQPLPDKYETGELKQCFMNAAKLALEHDELTYVEGYALGIIPVHHAWCVDKDGNVVDNTWTEFEGRDMLGQEYFGVPIDKEWLQKNMLDTQYYGVFGAYWDDFAVERGEKTGWKDTTFPVQPEQQREERARRKRIVKGKPFDESEHPRGPDGRWIDKPGVGAGASGDDVPVEIVEQELERALAERNRLRDQYTEIEDEYFAWLEESGEDELDLSPEGQQRQDRLLEAEMAYVDAQDEVDNLTGELSDEIELRDGDEASIFTEEREFPDTALGDAERALWVAEQDVESTGQAMAEAQEAVMDWQDNNPPPDGTEPIPDELAALFEAEEAAIAAHDDALDARTDAEIERDMQLEIEETDTPSEAHEAAQIEIHELSSTMKDMKDVHAHLTSRINALQQEIAGGGLFTPAGSARQMMEEVDQLIDSRSKIEDRIDDLARQIADRREEFGIQAGHLDHQFSNTHQDYARSADAADLLDEWSQPGIHSGFKPQSLAYWGDRVTLADNLRPDWKSRTGIVEDFTNPETGESATAEDDMEMFDMVLRLDDGRRVTIPWLERDLVDVRFESVHGQVKNDGAAWVDGRDFERKGTYDRIYQTTQARLRKYGMKSVQGYRGFGIPLDHPLAKAIINGEVKKDEMVLVDGLKFQSWSEDMSVAADFAHNKGMKDKRIGVLITSKFEPEDIFAGERTHLEFLGGEEEFIGINKGKNMKVRILMATHPNWTDNNSPPDR